MNKKDKFKEAAIPAPAAEKREVKQSAEMQNMAWAIDAGSQIAMTVGQLYFYIIHLKKEAEKRCRDQFCRAMKNLRELDFLMTYGPMIGRWNALSTIAGPVFGGLHKEEAGELEATTDQDEIERKQELFSPAPVLPAPPPPTCGC